MRLNHSNLERRVFFFCFITCAFYFKAEGAIYPTHDGLMKIFFFFLSFFSFYLLHFTLVHVLFSPYSLSFLLIFTRARVPGENPLGTLFLSVFFSRIHCVAVYSGKWIDVRSVWAFDAACPARVCARELQGERHVWAREWEFVAARARPLARFYSPGVTRKLFFGRVPSLAEGIVCEEGLTLVYTVYSKGRSARGPTASSVKKTERENEKEDVSVSMTLNCGKKREHRMSEEYYKR